MIVKIVLPKRLGYVLQNAYEVTANKDDIIINYIEYINDKRYKLQNMKFLKEDIEKVEIIYDNH